MYAIRGCTTVQGRLWSAWAVVPRIREKLVKIKPKRSEYRTLEPAVEPEIRQRLAPDVFCFFLRGGWEGSGIAEQHMVNEWKNGDTTGGAWDIRDNQSPGQPSWLCAAHV